MASEKEVREGSVRYPVCSRTGARCECECGLGCSSKADEPKLDKIAVEDVRHLKTARIYIEAAKDHLDEIQEKFLLTRRFPGPEIRDVRRKLETAQALIDELRGDSE